MSTTATTATSTVPMTIQNRWVEKKPALEAGAVSTSSSKSALDLLFRLTGVGTFAAAALLMFAFSLPFGRPSTEILSIDITSHALTRPPACGCGLMAKNARFDHNYVYFISLGMLSARRKRESCTHNFSALALCRATKRSWKFLSPPAGWEIFSIAVSPGAATMISGTTPRSL